MCIGPLTHKAMPLKNTATTQQKATWTLRLAMLPLGPALVHHPHAALCEHAAVAAGVDEVAVEAVVVAEAVAVAVAADVAAVEAARLLQAERHLPAPTVHQCHHQTLTQTLTLMPVSLMTTLMMMMMTLMAAEAAAAAAAMASASVSVSVQVATAAAAAPELLQCKLRSHSDKLLRAQLQLHHKRASMPPPQLHLQPLAQACS